MSMAASRGMACPKAKKARAPSVDLPFRSVVGVGKAPRAFGDARRDEGLVSVACACAQGSGAPPPGVAAAPMMPDASDLPPGNWDAPPGDFAPSGRGPQRSGGGVGRRGRRLGGEGLVRGRSRHQRKPDLWTSASGIRGAHRLHMHLAVVASAQWGRRADGIRDLSEAMCVEMGYRGEAR